MKGIKRAAFGLLLCILGIALIRPPALAEETGGETAVELTPEEEEFIRQHPVIHLGVDPTFVPYEFFDTDGQYKGIAADYIRLIGEKTGLNLVVTEGLTWTEAYEKAIRHEIDVLPCVAETAERERYFLFSDTYYTFQRAVFINADTTGLRTFDDLSGKTVAVQMNSSHHSYMVGFPDIKLSLYPTVEAALRAVSNKTEIAFIGNLATSSYLAKSLGLTNLKFFTIEADPSDQSQSLHFAVRKDWPELVSIINKALAGITKEERTEINNRWIGVEGTVDYSDVVRVIEIAALVLVLVVAVSYFWIIRLRREVRKRKEAQAALVAAKEEAEEANQVKSLFLARMSHEIRTPLSAIMGMAYLMKKTGLTATQATYLDKLTQAARNMLGTINDILDFSKIEAGKITIEKISFDLDRMLQRVVNIEAVKVQEQGIELLLEKDPALPAAFIGDPLRVEQILLNLVNNAVKFTEEGSVRVAVRPLDGAAGAKGIEFVVADTGIGMTQEQIDHLFVPFDQGDSSISRRFGGSGLGLSIVKSLVDLMEGSIAVTSEKGRGSTFTVRLPLEADPAQGGGKSARLSAEYFRNTRALVLDRSESSRSQLAACFASFGIAADLADSEQAALRLLRQAEQTEHHPYELLLIDYVTPQDNGIGLYQRLRSERLIQPSAKTILLLPMMREDLIAELEAAGMDFGVTKPVIPSVLYNGIVEILQIGPPRTRQPSREEDRLVSPHPYAVLLVEDNKTNQFIAKSILEQAGFLTQIASDGEEGYRFFAGHSSETDLILMDLHMPVMDGYTASELIRKISADVPIVAMTADAIAGVEEKCRSHGIYSYVSKPFEPERLIETLLALLNGKTPKKPGVQESLPDGAAAGVDFADGLRRIGGDETVFRVVLQAFYNENLLVGEELQKALAAKEIDRAEQIVHKMKGSAGNVGAKPLYDAAVELQGVLKEKDDAAALRLLEPYLSILGKTLAEVRKQAFGDD